MSSNSSEFCRTLVIESIGLSDMCLSLVGKSVFQTLRVAANRVTNKTFTHLNSYLLDTKVIQISELSTIFSDQFSNEYLKRFYDLKRPKKRLFEENSCETICGLFKDIKHELNQFNDKLMTEISYISGRNTEEVIDDFLYAFSGQQIDSSFISQINIGFIKARVDSNTEEFNQIPIELRSLIEIQFIDENEYSMDAYFKLWLTDVNVKYERVRIYLNTKTEDTVNGSNFAIKCDLREALVDMNRLSVDNSGKRLNTSQIQALESLPNIYETNGCHELELLGLIRDSGLCESILFGIPYILCATRSTALDFNEMRINYQRFQALIQILNEKQSVMILQTKNKTNGKSLHFLYAILPTLGSNTLLMKTIASQELVIPKLPDSVDKLMCEPPSKLIIDSIKQQLNDCPFADIYNPLLIKTNFLNVLFRD